jgi:peptidoglycan/xylan/chitin deacetylase (PgdA/CDA1 family)
MKLALRVKAWRAFGGPAPGKEPAAFWNGGSWAIMASQGLTALRVATFLFHDVVDRPEDSGFQRPGALPYKHRPEAFLRYLDAISESPVQPTLVDTITPSARGDRILLTFDDGGVSAMRVAGLLEERGWRGHFFITTNRIGTRQFLGRAEICDLQRRGHRIGSHSHSHPDIFYDLSTQAMIDEWQASLDILSEITGETTVMASIPGGDLDKRVPLAAEHVGVRYLFTSEPTVRPWRCGKVLCFGRVCPKATARVAAVREFARFRGFHKAMAVHRIKQAAKWIVYRLRTKAAARRRPTHPDRGLP